MTKLHLAAGDIYLDGYTNCDIQGVFSHTVTSELIEANKTTLNKYFKYSFIQDDIERQANRRPVIIDMQFDMLNDWNIEKNSVDEIVMIAAIEHFTPKEGIFIAKQIANVLKTKGQIIVTFPNIKKTVDFFYYSYPEFCSTLIYGNWKNQYSVHKTFYTPKMFMKLFIENTSNYWTWKDVDIINHDYPTYQLEITKET